MVDEYAGLGGILDRVKVDKAHSSLLLLVLGAQPLHLNRWFCARRNKQTLQLRVRQFGDVKEMQNLGGMNNSILPRRVGRNEPVSVTLVGINLDG